jgi:hypothetical protein
MFDIAYISKEEVQNLLWADASGIGNRMVR